MVVLAQLVRAFVCGTKGHGVVARTLPKGELSELVYRTCLLNRQTFKKVSGVRVPHSPQKYI